MPTWRPAWRRPSGPTFPELVRLYCRPGHWPIRHIPGGMSAYFLRSGRGFIGQARGDKARAAGRTSLRGTGIIRSMSWHSVIVEDACDAACACARVAGACAARGALRAWRAAACSTRTTDRSRRAGRQALQRGPLSSEQQEGPRRRGQEVRGGRPPASVFGLGAQVADHVGLRLLRGRHVRRLDHCRAALRHAASRQPGRRLCAVS